MKPSTQPRHAKLHWVQLLLCSITTVVLFIGLLALIIYHFFDFRTLASSSCSKAEVLVYCFYDDNWDSETYLALITSFYSTVIAFLIVVITIISGIAYFAVKSSHSQQIDEAVEAELPRYFDRVSSREIVTNQIKPIVKQETSLLEGRLSRLDEQVQQLEEEAGLSSPRSDETESRIEL